MKIQDNYYISGMPANDTYKLEIGKGLVLELNPHEFRELTFAIDEKLSSDLERIEKATERFYSKAKKVEAFIKDLQNIFYHGDEDGDILFRTEIKDIDEDKLYDCLENHKSILGLE